jgi:very-short-patch-repair endonuclease
MQNGASNENSEQQAPSISADFLTGSTEIGLDRIRTRLLDLTNRNKLLNFRHSNASSLRVVDVPIDSVFRRLRDNERLSFLPVPAANVDGSEGPTAKDYADDLGWNTSFDLDEVADDDNGKSLPVLHYQEKLDTVSRKIATAAKTAIEESGTNMLYLVFGFLEWYESDDSRQPHLAPLVILPVTIERAGGKGRAVETVLEYSGEDLESNLSLVEKMRRDFGLELPLLEDDDTPEAYFEKFADILKLKKHWSIRRQIALALLSFGKLLMYRDLDPKTWPAGQSIAKHLLVRELFEGSKNPNITLAEEYPIDEPELKKDVPDLIRDADSSQHSALVHALRGQNLVIEGPPGTGKSQTITNLIAAALARGKTVLFVSEKLAALEVVRRRLDDAGLGVFCLEVHSHKTKKGALLNDLAQRHQMRGSFKDPRDLDRHLSIVEEKKTLLTHYASLVNKTIEPFKATVFEILWARDRSGQDISVHRDRVGQVVLPVVVQYTRTQFTQTEQFLSVYAQHLTAVLAPCNSIDQHPWAWITNPLDFAGEERVQGLLRGFITTIRNAEQCCEHLEQSAGITLPRTSRGLEHAAQTLALLPSPGAVLIEELLAPCQAAANRQALVEFIGHVESFRRGIEKLSASASNVSSLLDTQIADKLASALECLRQWGLERHSVIEIKALLDACTGTARLLEEAHASFRLLLNVMGCDAPVTLASAGFLLETVRIMETAPFEQLHLRQPSFESERTRPMLQTARQQATLLKNDEASLGAEFDLSLCAGTHTPAQLLECSAVLDKASLWKRFFGRDYRGAVNTYRRIVFAGKKVPRAHMSRALRTVADYAQKRAQFDNHASYREMLGVHFKGVQTPWDDLDAVLAWYERIFVALPEHLAPSEPFRHLVFTARSDRLKAIKASLVSTEEHRAALDQIVSRVADFTRSVPSQRSLMVSGSFDEILGRLNKLTRELNDVLLATTAAAVSDEVSLRDIPNMLAAAGQCRDAMAAVEAAAAIPALIGSTYRGVKTDTEPIKHTVQIAESITSGSLPEKAVQWLLCRDIGARLTDMRSWLGDANACGANLHALAEDLTALSGAAFWSGNANNPWGSLYALAEYALANLEELPQWNHFLRVRIKSKEGGLERLTAMAESRALEPHELGPAFHFAFYNTLTRSVFTEHAELSQVTGITQEQVRRQFAAADKESIRLYSERVAALIDQRPVPYGNQSGPVRTWTEMALIMNEINKQKRHIPIRQLILRSANALVALKPCFMMGPLSVAQYLAPGQLKFDLVVMDEASQLKPEDAIGAIARGGQIVIVGDPKQLPPTSFFQRVSLDAEDDNADDDRAAVEEGESILDVASTLFQPVRRLRWHYRSRHHSLIAFSNNEFYQRNLIIFPSAYHDDPSLGVKHHFIRDGVFDNGRNPREAAVVVEAVLEHMRQHPDESLGVVTLNFEQRELVEELLDRQLRDDPAAIAFQEKMKGGQETLFVKNLENVQGDERDVIFISTTYGSDTRGNQFQRFGPINGPSGHRRLNVLFTRAKKRTVVFSSLDPERIQTTANSPWGVRALKQYLIYARTGILQQADEGLDQVTNDFERSVGDALKEKGYDVVPQIGVAGFFIDLGVRHPAKAGAFLLGIECDGASYHSGRSARDRDRLRQEILENLGWKIHRIWSTDWFKSRDGEIKRLLRSIEELLKNDPAYRKEHGKVARIESLRQRLIALRETEIKPAFPDSPDEKGLLRDSLLEEFIQKRPKTKDDWFRKIPQEFRTNVESKQVGRYLERVLEIIAESER